MRSHTLVSVTTWRNWLAALASIGVLACLVTSATAQGQRPAKLTGLTAEIVGNKQVKFTWDNSKDSSIDRVGYRYDRSSPEPEAWDQPWTNTRVNRPARATSWVWKAPGGEPYGTYYFHFRVRNASGWSARSDLVTVELAPKK